MKIGFVINDFSTEHPNYTTTHLGLAAYRRGHEVWHLTVADFIYMPDGSIHASARRAPKATYRSSKAYLEALREKAKPRELVLDKLDVLMLRNDPANDAAERPWAQTSAILFGQLASLRGVLVVNDPERLANAVNKTYFQQFPEAVRPETLITRDRDQIRKFIGDHEGTAVLKPLQGSGGHSVFLVRPGEEANLNQMVEAITRDGYAVVQEYLPAAAEGDIRLFVLNGSALEENGKFAAFRRVSSNGDLRSNLSAGGRIAEAEVDAKALELVEMIRPKLVRDGMYLVGIDVVGDKLMEINVFSPGGLNVVERLTGVDFADHIIRDLERKVCYRTYYGREISNVELSTL